MFIFKKYFLSLLCLFFVIISFTPNYVFAGLEENFFPIINCGGNSTTKTDPCTFEDAVETFNRLINWFVTIASSIGAATLAYAGIQILIHPGNASKITEAREMFFKTLLGLFWLLASWVVVYSLINVFVDDSINASRFLK